ncbi:MAG: hypothetical protein HUU10_04405 [Bacteroidetes bacterium]|nr:hypothetical protein [Bacteroidota bacterium]
MIKTKTFYIELTGTDRIEAFHPVSLEAGKNRIPVVLPEENVMQTQYGTFLLTGLDLTPVSKSVTVDNGFYTEKITTPSGILTTVNYKPVSLDPLPIQKNVVVREGIVTDIVGPIAIVQQFNGTKKPVPVNGTVVIAKSFIAYLDMESEARDMRRDAEEVVSAIQKEQFTQIAKSLSFMGAKAPTIKSAPVSMGPPPVKLPSATKQTTPVPTAIPGQSRIGSTRPNHKYIMRKDNPRYPGGSSSRYIYLYELPNGKREWREQDGSATTDSPAPKAQPVHQTGAQKPAASEGTTTPNPSGVAPGQPAQPKATKTNILQKIVDLVRKKRGTSVRPIEDEKPKGSEAEAPSTGQSQPEAKTTEHRFGKGSEFTFKGRNDRIYQYLDDLDNGRILARDDIGRAHVFDYNDTKSRLGAHRNGDQHDQSTVLIGSVPHDIVHKAGNLLLLRHPETGKLQFHGTFDSPVRAENITDANQQIEQQRLDSEERARQWEEQNRQAQRRASDLQAHAEAHGFTMGKHGRWEKKIDIMGSEAHAEMAHDGNRIVTRFNGNPLKWTIAGDKRELVDIDQKTMTVTARGEDGTISKHPFTEVLNLQPGTLQFNQDGSVSVQYEGQTESRHDRVSLDHLGQFSPLQLIQDHKAAFVVKSAVYAAIQNGDRIEYLKVGDIGKGTVLAKGKFAAGVIDEQTSRPTIVNARNIHNIGEHDSSSAAHQAIQQAFAENATKNLQSETVSRQEAITGHQASIEGHRQQIEDIKAKLQKETNPDVRNRLVTDLAHAELQHSTAREAILRAQTYTGARIPKNIVGYHQARKQKDDLQVISDGHARYIEQKRARLAVLSEKHASMHTEGNHSSEESGQLIKELWQTHSDIERSTKAKAKVDRQIEKAHDTMISVSSATGGYVPSNLSELEFHDPAHKTEAYGRLNNPRNDIRGADGNALPQYTTPGQLREVVSKHLDAFADAKPHEKPMIANRLNEFLSGARVITDPEIKPVATEQQSFRPFSEHEETQFPALQHIDQMVRDHDFGTELIPAMVRELSSHPQLAGTGLTEHDAIHQAFGIQLKKRTPEHSRFTQDVLPKADKPEESVKPTIDNPAGKITTSPVHDPIMNDKAVAAELHPVTQEHFSDPSKVEALGDLDQHGELTHGLGQAITDQKRQEDQLAGHFTDENGSGLPLHNLEGQDGVTLANAHEAVKQEAIRTHEQERQQGSTNPVIATRMPDDELPIPISEHAPVNQFGPVGMTNPLSLRVHKVDKKKLLNELSKNTHLLPPGVTPESVMAKLNIGDPTDEHSDYQGRDKTDVARALGYGLSWNPAEQEGEPVQYHTPDGGQSFHVFSGNHRTLGAQLHAAIYGKIPAFYTRQFTGTKPEAVKLGDKANNKGEKENQKEMAYKVRKWADERGGKNFAESIRQEMGWSKERIPEINQLHKLSHLDRDGMFWEKMDDPAYKEMKVDKFADGVAGMRKTYPQLSHYHEQQIFDHLFNNKDQLMDLLRKKEVKGPGGQMMRPQTAIMSKIDQAVQMRIADGNFTENTPLNLDVLTSVKKTDQAPANFRNLDEQERERYEELKPMFGASDSQEQQERHVSNYVDARSKAHKESTGKVPTTDQMIQWKNEADKHLATLRAEFSGLHDKLHFVDENQEDMFAAFGKSAYFLKLSNRFDWIAKSTQGEVRLFGEKYRHLNAGPSGKNRWLRLPDSVKTEQIAKLIASKPIDITGHEISTDTSWGGLRKTISEKVRRNEPPFEFLSSGKGAKTSFKNIDTGSEIHLMKTAYDEITRHDMPDVQHLQSVVAIPEIIKRSIYIGERENQNPHNLPWIKKYQYFVVGIKINGVDYVVKADVAVEKGKAGRRYYDHKLTEIEKGKLVDVVASISRLGHIESLPSSEIKDKRLLEIMQDHFPKDDNSKGLKDVVKSVISLFQGDWDIITKSWYKIKQMTFAGLPISIENKKGTYREGADKDGHHWKVKMHHDYGYIRRTEGTDGDQLDVYIGPDEDFSEVFVIHQNDPVTGKYDEDKVMLGFSSATEAKKAYQKQYDRPGFYGSMEIFDRERFEEMVRSKAYKGKPISTIRKTA